MRLHALQAQFGDCLLLEYSEAGEARFILIDGGPKDTYPLVLRDELERLVAPASGLELVILSHVDNDHAIGLIEMLSELRAERETAGGPEPLPVKKLWHNAFSQEIGDDVANRPRHVSARRPRHGNELPGTRSRGVNKRPRCCPL